LEGFTLDAFAADMARPDTPFNPTVEQTELNGRKVVVVSAQDGSKLYVANTGAAYPLRVEDKGQQTPGSMDFTEYGADFHITPPEGTVELRELAWLKAVEKLSTKMEKIFTQSPTDLTPSAMASLGEQLRGAVAALSNFLHPANGCGRPTRSSRRPAMSTTRARAASPPPPASASQSPARPPNDSRPGRWTAGSPPAKGSYLWTTPSTRPPRSPAAVANPTRRDNPQLVAYLLETGERDPSRARTGHVRHSDDSSSWRAANRPTRGRAQAIPTRLGWLGRRRG
jgi:hypothetical protein